MEGVPPNSARPPNQSIGVSRRFEASRLADQLLGAAYQRIVCPLEPVTDRCHTNGLATKRRSPLTTPRTSTVGA